MHGHSHILLCDVTIESSVTYCTVQNSEGFVLNLFLQVHYMMSLCHHSLFTLTVSTDPSRLRSEAVCVCRTHQLLDVRGNSGRNITFHTENTFVTCCNF